MGRQMAAQNQHRNQFSWHQSILHSCFLEPVDICLHPLAVLPRGATWPQGTVSEHGQEPSEFPGLAFPLWTKDWQHHGKADDDEHEYQLPLRTMQGLVQKVDCSLSKQRQMNYETTSVKVTLATLKMSPQPTLSPGGCEIIPPVVLRLQWSQSLGM